MPNNADPCVWALLCYRAGENTQILALAEALGLPYEVKRLVYRRGGRLADVWRGANLLGVNRKRSDALAPPWPDLVISASMRNEPVCRWIREQSGGRSRYVHIGKPWGGLESFDLVITVPEYPTPDAPNVLRNKLSLHPVSSRRLLEAARTWGPRFAHLPRPHVAVLVGGYSGPYAFDAENARCLGEEASAMARRLGGSLLVTTSARTSRRALAALTQAIDVPCLLHEWQPERDNPYIAFLALAERFIVTCESATMLAEACATGKRVYMFDLGARPAKSIRMAARRLVEPDRVRALLYRKIMWGLAPKPITRDIRVVHRFLAGTGRAVWLGEEFSREPPPPCEEMPRTLARIQALPGMGVARVPTDSVVDATNLVAPVRRLASETPEGTT